MAERVKTVHAAVQKHVRIERGKSENMLARIDKLEAIEFIYLTLDGKREDEKGSEARHD